VAANRRRRTGSFLLPFRTALSVAMTAVALLLPAAVSPFSVSLVGTKTKPATADSKLWIGNRRIDSLQQELDTLPAVATTDTISDTSSANKNDNTPAMVMMDALAYMETAPAGDITSSNVGIGASSSTSTAVAAAAVDDDEYRRGLLTIGFITLLFSSNSPVLHAAFSCGGADATVVPPPVLLLNAAVSVVALVGLALGGEGLEKSSTVPSSLRATYEGGAEGDGGINAATILKGGVELGFWKFLGTTANLYGLSLTTADHGAFLIQLTTLIVPVAQGIMGVPIPRRIQFAVVLALAGVACFTQDNAATAATTETASAAQSSSAALGDWLCVVAAGFYATYDLRLFEWGKRIAPRKLITTKIATQALLSIALLLSVSGSWQECSAFFESSPDWTRIAPVVLWSGVAVNAVAPFLQVGGQQVVGPTRCQTVYASQPLWASIMSYFALGETVGFAGLVGGGAFLSALLLAATADAPDPDCGDDVCEV